MQLEKGRPQSVEGRLEKEIKVYDFLDSLGVNYERIDHEAAMTMEACEEIDQVLGAAICKNLLLCNRQETFGCHPCMNTSSLKFRTEDLEKIVIPAMKHEPMMVRL